MNKQTQQAIAYAQNALSFVFLDATITNKCNAVYLFGSAARGDMERESDIDIFFDFEEKKENKEEKKEKNKEAEINAALKRFYQSKDYDKWKLFSFTYPISIKVGKLDEWELKTSILADGIILYSKELLISKTKRYVLIMYTLPRKKAKYLSLVRTLFGRNETGYKDTGLVGMCHAKKIAATVIIVPKEHVKPLFTLLQKEKIDYSFNEINLIE